MIYNKFFVDNFIINFYSAVVQDFKALIYFQILLVIIQN